MAKGTVKWFDPKKGFGFIVNDDGVDVFVHYSSIQQEGFRCLRTGQIVDYSEISGGNGLRGIGVVVVDDNQPCDVDVETVGGEIE